MYFYFFVIARFACWWQNKYYYFHSMTVVFNLFMLRTRNRPKMPVSMADPGPHKRHNSQKLVNRTLQSSAIIIIHCTGMFCLLSVVICATRVHCDKLTKRDFHWILAKCHIPKFDDEIGRESRWWGLKLRWGGSGFCSTISRKQWEIHGLPIGIKVDALGWPWAVKTQMQLQATKT